MHSENSYLKSPNPSFLDMYISKLNSIGYGYTYAYHWGAPLLVMHGDIYNKKKQLLDMTPCIFGHYACAYINFSTYLANIGFYYLPIKNLLVGC